MCGFPFTPFSQYFVKLSFTHVEVFGEVCCLFHSNINQKYKWNLASIKLIGREKRRKQPQFPAWSDGIVVQKYQVKSTSVSQHLTVPKGFEKERPPEYSSSPKHTNKSPAWGESQRVWIFLVTCLFFWLKIISYLCQVLFCRSWAVWIIHRCLQW